MMTEWKTIESAPKGGSRILVWPVFKRSHKGPQITYQIVMVARWNANGYWIMEEGRSSRPTHWMHLPEPPK